MSHGKPPRKPRWPAAVNTMDLVSRRVALVTPADLEQVMEPLQTAFTALREGVATEWQWSVLASAMNCAQAIEKQGVVRQLAGHLRAAELALQSIYNRAMATGKWQSTSLYYIELDAIDTAIDLHKFQLQQLSTGEVIKALDYAQAASRSSGGRVMRQRDLLAA